MNWKTLVLLLFTLATTSVAHADAESDFRAGRDALDREDFAQAVQLFTRVLNSSGVSDENRVITLLNRGDAWHAQGDFDRAIADFNEAIRLDPRQADAFNLRGNVWFEKGDLDRAIADYEKAIRVDPTHVQANENLTSAKRRKEKDKTQGSASEKMNQCTKTPSAGACRNVVSDMIWRYERLYGCLKRVDLDALTNSVVAYLKKNPNIWVAMDVETKKRC